MKRFMGIFGLWAVFVIAANVALLWAASSAVTSGIKAGTDNCGQTYVAEKVLQGNWFCPEKE